MSPRRRVVVGIGSRFRRDDAAGLYVADWLRDRLPGGVELLAIEGDATTLLDVFDSSELVILIDSVAAAAAPGLIYRFDATDQPVPGSVFGASTHAFGVGEAIELARALGRLRCRVLVYGVSGQDFSVGEGLSASVADAVHEIAMEVLRDLAQAGPEVARPDLKTLDRNGAPHARARTDG